MSSRKISFSAPSSPIPTNKNPADLLSQIDNINFNSTSPVKNLLDISSTSSDLSRSSCKCKIRRSRVITKNSRVNRSMLGCLSNSRTLSTDSLDEKSVVLREKSQSPPPPYHNETVYFGTYEDILLMEEKSIAQPQSPNNYVELLPAGTSTPKMCSPNVYMELPTTPISNRVKPINLTFEEEANEKYNEMLESLSSLLPPFKYYYNPLLNGHSGSVQSWIDDLRKTCSSDVMSTLQSKSVETAKTTTLTPTISYQMIKSLQTKVHILQTEFEKVEKMFSQQEEESEDHLLPSIQSLTTLVINFVIKQEPKKSVYADSAKELTKLEDNLRSIREMSIDLKSLAGKIDIDDVEDCSIEEDVGILKRYFLITVRMMFERLVRTIVDSIDDTKCDMILRSNLTYVATLSNYEYCTNGGGGFASLNDAFVCNGIVRVLLLVCMEHKETSIRALALRALATVCSTMETIRQLEIDGGLEILRDIMVDKTVERSEQELRETVSVLTQITAPWQQSENNFDGLKECVEGVVESITKIVETTECCQTLLICAACLNNLSRMETTSIYSLMSHESILKLKTASDKRGPGASIFLYEQITTMMYNMSLNKRSHHHLSNKHIIAFILNIFQSKFYEKFESRAENMSQKKIIRNILHVFSHLINESVVSQEVLDGNIIPVLSRIERKLDEDNEYYRDISYINRKFNESLTSKYGNNSGYNSAGNSSPLTITQRKHEYRRSKISIDQNRQESYV